LGIFEGQEFEADQIQLNSGDRLFIYSDGLEDGKNPKGELYTSERLLESFLQDEVTVEKIIGDIDQFVEDEPQYDDLTLLVLDRI